MRHGPGHGFDRRLADFNPRTRKGCDQEVEEQHFFLAWISIHAPVKGATRNRFYAVQLPRIISIHAPVKGATALAAAVFEALLISIHAPVKGATAFKLTQSLSALSSIILRMIERQFNF